MRHQPVSVRRPRKPVKEIRLGEDVYIAIDADRHALGLRDRPLESVPAGAQYEHVDGLACTVEFEQHARFVAEQEKMPARLVVGERGQIAQHHVRWGLRQPFVDAEV